MLRRDREEVGEWGGDGEVEGLEERGDAGREEAEIDEEAACRVKVWGQVLCFP